MKTYVTNSTRYSSSAIHTSQKFIPTEKQINYANYLVGALATKLYGEMKYAYGGGCEAFYSRFVKTIFGNEHRLSTQPRGWLSTGYSYMTKDEFDKFVRVLKKKIEEIENSTMA